MVVRESLPISHKQGERYTVLLLCPGLGFVEHGDVAADFPVVAFEPDGAFVGLAVLGIVYLSTFPLIAFLGETRQDVDTNKFAAL